MKALGGRLNPTAETHAPFMSMLFVRSHEEGEYKGWAMSLMTQLRADAAIT